MLLSLKTIGLCFLVPSLASRLEIDQERDVDILEQLDKRIVTFTISTDEFSDMCPGSRFAKIWPEILKEQLGLLLAANLESGLASKFKDSPYSPQIAHEYLSSIEAVEQTEAMAYGAVLKALFSGDYSNSFMEHTAVREYIERRLAFEDKLFKAGITVASQVGGMIAAKGIFSSALHFFVPMMERFRVTRFTAICKQIFSDRKDFALLGASFYSLIPVETFPEEIVGLAGEAVEIELNLFKSVSHEPFWSLFKEAIEESARVYVSKARECFETRKRAILSNKFEMLEKQSKAHSISTTGRLELIHGDDFTFLKELQTSSSAGPTLMEKPFSMFSDINFDWLPTDFVSTFGLLLASGSEERLGFRFKHSPYSPLATHEYLSSMARTEQREAYIYEAALKILFSANEVRSFKSHSAVESYLGRRKEFTERIFKAGTTVAAQVGGMIAAKTIFSSALQILVKSQMFFNSAKFGKISKQVFLDRNNFALFGGFLYSLIPGEIFPEEIVKLFQEAIGIELDFANNVLPQPLCLRLSDSINYFTKKCMSETRERFKARRQIMVSRELDTLEKQFSAHSISTIGRLDPFYSDDFTFLKELQMSSSISSILTDNLSSVLSEINLDSIHQDFVLIFALLLASSSGEGLGFRFKHSPYSPPATHEYLSSMTRTEQRETDIYKAALEIYSTDDVHILKSHYAVESYLGRRKEFTERIFRAGTTVAAQVGGMIAAKTIFASALHILVKSRGIFNSPKFGEIIEQISLDRNNFALFGGFLYSLIPGEIFPEEIVRLTEEAARIELSLFEDIIPAPSFCLSLRDSINELAEKCISETRKRFTARKQNILLQNKTLI